MTTVDLILSRVPGIREVLKHEPEILPNIAAASTATILAVMLCLIERAEHTTTSIHIQLEERGCIICFSRIEALLREFDGSDPRKHLWQQLPDGVFMPLFEGGTDFPDDWLDDDEL
jgi:hypothetical protein